MLLSDRMCCRQCRMGAPALRVWVAVAAGAICVRQELRSGAARKGQLLFPFPQLKCRSLFISLLKFGGNYNNKRIAAASCTSRSN